MGIADEGFFIKIKKETADKLSTYRKAGETWTDVIEKLIKKYEESKG